jgi:hypothetical protein
MDKLMKEAEANAADVFVPYDNEMKPEMMKSNKDVRKNVEEFEDDFM